MLSSWCCLTDDSAESEPAAPFLLLYLLQDEYFKACSMILLCKLHPARYSFLLSLPSTHAATACRILHLCSICLFGDIGQATIHIYMFGLDTHLDPGPSHQRSTRCKIWLASNIHYKVWAKVLKWQQKYVALNMSLTAAWLLPHAYSLAHQGQRMKCTCERKPELIQLVLARLADMVEACCASCTNPVNA